MPYAVNGGVRIHYEVEGNGTPLMLQHGFAATLWTWRDFGYARELGKNYRLILVDARGHGESDKPHDPEAYRPEIIAGDYITILNDLGIEKTHYLGYSMGARIALSCLARYALPRFKSFILGGVSISRRPSGERRSNDFTRMLEEAAEKGMNFWVAEREKMLGITLTPEQRSRQLANDPHALLALRRKTQEWGGAEDILSKIRIPCLVFVGEADPSYTPAKEAVSSLPGCVFASIPGLNHDQTLMHSELVLPHIKNFLTEVIKD